MSMHIITTARRGRPIRSGTWPSSRSPLVAAAVTLAAVMLLTGCANQAHNLDAGYDAQGTVVSHDLDAHTLVMRVASAARGVWAVTDVQDQEIDVVFRPGDLSCSSGAGVATTVPEGTFVSLIADSGEIGLGNPRVTVSCRVPATNANGEASNPDASTEPVVQDEPDPVADELDQGSDPDEFYDEPTDPTDGAGLDPVLSFPSSWGL